MKKKQTKLQTSTISPKRAYEPYLQALVYLYADKEVAPKNPFLEENDKLQ